MRCLDTYPVYTYPVLMSNVTLAIDDRLLEAARNYAQAHDTTVNALVRKLLEQTVRYEAGDWAEEFIALATRTRGSSAGKRWTRDELHERPWVGRMMKRRKRP